ncbi:hypothetical protein GPECTOR_80g152 [Gonium pectorale]|uniref:Uncharacterized protein n=1 Tax=Gonium pectorale TaxID=33097 RepID=A0A150G1P5_GONPE|nr:hypothetical protein GPECTOR_80g152 [Gonium pectorale]|eukprot:KXZ43792.1 hypothetical protein GPECTOR_80g152 [Gonium pectorale]
MYGTGAHGLSLFFKDAASKLGWTKGVVEAVLHMSLTVNGGERIRAALQSAQVAVFGKPRAITVHAPTRFAVQLMIGKDVMRSKEAFFKVVCNDWESASDGERAAEFRNTVLANGEHSKFWDHLARYIEAMPPFSDAIHQLEGDRPMLSQVYDVLVQLRSHLEDFEKRHPTLKGLKALYDQRINAAVKLIEEVYAGKPDSPSYEERKEQIKRKVGSLMLSGIPSELEYLMDTLTTRKEMELPGGGKRVEVP